MSLTDRSPIFDDHVLLANIAEALNRHRAELTELRRHLEFMPWDCAYAGSATATGQDCIQATKCYVDTVINNSDTAATVTLYDGNVPKVTLPFTATVPAYTSLAVPINDTLYVVCSVPGTALYFAGRIRW